MLLVGLAVGIGLAIGVPALLDGGGDGNSDEAADTDDAGGDVTLDETRQDLLDDLGDGPVPEGAGAESAEAAVEGFLTAEADEDYLESFGFLSAGDRQAFRSPEGWVANHASLLAPITGYEIGEVREGDGATQVASTVSFEPSLNQVTGLTPAQAEVTWSVNPDDAGSWGVDLEASAIEPRYPSDEGAPAAVQAWAESRQAGEAEGQIESLLGSPTQAEALDATSGPVEVGEPAPLDDLDATTFVSAYGASADRWARVVPVTSPVELRAVVAPIGETWTVIGVLP